MVDNARSTSRPTRPLAPTTRISAVTRRIVRQKLDTTRVSRSSGLMKPVARRRVARKLVLPLVALGMMISAMYLGSAGRPHPAAAKAPAAARLSHAR